jgi:hypothetical protein
MFTAVQPLVVMFVFMTIGWDDVSEPPMGLFFIPQVIYDCGESRWNGTDRGKLKNSEKKPVPVSFLAPQIPRGLAQASAVGGWRLTAWAMTWPTGCHTQVLQLHSVLLFTVTCSYVALSWRVSTIRALAWYDRLHSALLQHCLWPTK